MLILKFDILPNKPCQDTQVFLEHQKGNQGGEGERRRSGGRRKDMCDVQQKGSWWRVRCEIIGGSRDVENPLKHALLKHCHTPPNAFYANLKMKITRKEMQAFLSLCDFSGSPTLSCKVGCPSTSSQNRHLSGFWIPM